MASISQCFKLFFIKLTKSRHSDSMVAFSIFKLSANMSASLTASASAERLDGVLKVLVVPPLTMPLLSLMIMAAVSVLDESEKEASVLIFNQEGGGGLQITASKVQTTTSSQCNALAGTRVVDDKTEGQARTQ